MSLEAIKDITKAEELSRERLIDARQNAKARVQAAEQAAETAMTAAIARADEEITALKKATEERAAELREEKLSNTSNKCAAMRAHAESRLDAAAALIAERFVKS